MRTYAPAYLLYVVGLLSLANMLSSMDRVALSIMLPAIKADFAFSDLQLGVLTGVAFSVFYALFGIPIARRADGGNRRDVISVAVFVWSLMTALTGAAQNFLHVLLARIGVGIGEAGCIPPAHSMIVDYFPPERRPIVFAVHSAAGPFGALVGLALGGWLASQFGWRWTFVLFGAPGLVIALLLRATLREPERVGAAEQQARPPLVPALRELIGRRAFAFLFAGITFAGVGVTGLTTWLPSYFARAYGLGLAQVGLSFGLAFGLGSLAGMLLGGPIGASLMRRDPRWALWLASLGYLGAWPLVALALATQDLVLVVALLFAAFTIVSICIGPVYAMIQMIAPPRSRALAVAATLMSATLFGGLGPVLVGYLSDVFNTGDAATGLRTALWCVMLVFPINIVLYWCGAQALGQSAVESAAIASERAGP